MIISFFKNNSYTIGIDYSEHPDLVYQEDISDFDPETQTVELQSIWQWDNWLYKIIVKDIPPSPETEEEKFARIFQKICSLDIILNADTDHSILEWVEFSDTAIGDVIATKVFPDEKTGKWNPHGQMAMMAKVLANPAFATSEEVQKKIKAIDDIRVFFGLSRMTPEARTAFRSRQ